MTVQVISRSIDFPIFGVAANILDLQIFEFHAMNCVGGQLVCSFRSTVPLPGNGLYSGCGDLVDPAMANTIEPRPDHRPMKMAVSGKWRMKSVWTGSLALLGMFLVLAFVDIRIVITVGFLLVTVLCLFVFRTSSSRNDDDLE